jgi:hypothetical protein
MNGVGAISVLFLATSPVASAVAEPQAGPLTVGFGETDITPDVSGPKPVYMAGFGQNRKATGVYDPLKARAIVLKDGGAKVALVSVDLVGLFLDETIQVRRQLPGFKHLVISCTHNHEGPDTMGLWGQSPVQSGIDPAYLDLVRQKIVEAVKAADASAAPAAARIGVAHLPELLADGREPCVKQDELVVLTFSTPGRQSPTGLCIQWNCHPETLGSRNTKISADFVGPLVEQLRRKYNCPVVHFTGVVGGLMTTLGLDVRDAQGRVLADNSMEKTQRYAAQLAEQAEKLVDQSQPVRLVPIRAKSCEVFVPLDNPLYLLGRTLGVLQREAFAWEGNPYKAEKVTGAAPKRFCLRTEVGWLALGDLDVALIPGEIYPELVLGKVQDPVDPGADFPTAPVEPAIYGQLPGRWRMILGLANDEIGYIIPKRQWDEKPPFCYGRKKTQYGEVNSVGPETAPIICEAFRRLVKEKP